MSTLTRIQEVLGQITGSEYLSLKKIEDGNFKGHVVTLDPANLKAIDIDVWTPGSSGPVLGAERWVEACNPDGSPLNETSKSEWIFSDGIDRKIWLDEYDGWTWEAKNDSNSWGFCPSTHESDLTILKLADDSYTSLVPEVTAYRKYTPGHWEDADGNWINGSWNAWSNESIKGWGEYYDWDDSKGDYAPSGKYAWMYNDMEPITTEEGSWSYNTDENYYTTVLYGWKQGQDYIVTNRTWTTNKDKNGNPV